ncbi:Mis6 domain-containing protein [Arthroderma uncinatum]|uniref:Mis6 domain-containing protein n=1 Tax=Arthroderma uncinatum TaxID=74035 RepID=UPI00144AB320|nr:Mis6 domain-containing protein [Arthroderma uncinatum]KAF3490643.1 Mis6 domain-containing protein [Arthroderma uncinatum]
MAWTLEEAVTQLESVANVPPKQRHTNVAELTKVIASTAYESGLGTKILGRILKVIVSSRHLDQSTVTSIVKNLYPSERVPSKIVTRVICVLGATKSKPSPATQNLLLRWLLLVYDSLADQAHLWRFYSILFDNLDMISLRRPICHILSLITRRKHVKPFRIWALLELIRNTGGDERELWGLLRVYKSYYPDIIIDDTAIPRRKATYFFKHPDPEWTAHMKMLQEKAATTTSQAAPESFQAIRRDGVKRSRIEVVIPVPKTSRVRRGFTSLEELSNVRDFVNKLDKIELPNQIASALTEPLTQKFLLLVQNKEALERMESWLTSFFEDELDQLHEEGQNPSEELGLALDMLSFPEAVDNFLQTYLPVWDGISNRTVILDLLEYVPIHDAGLYGQYLLPLESAILDNTTESKSLLLRYYAALIRRYGSILRSNTPVNQALDLATIINRAELVSLTLLECPVTPDFEEPKAEKSSSSSIIQFYVQLAELYLHAPTNSLIRLNTPPPESVYILLFTPILSHLSLMSTVIANYKYSFEQSLATTASADGSSRRPYPDAVVTNLNGHVLDVCNLLWRNRGLNGDEPNALGCLVREEVAKLLTEYIQGVGEDLAKNGKNGGIYRLRLASIFSLSHHTALCGMSAMCFRNLESNAGKDGQHVSARLTWPVTQKALNALNKTGGIKVDWQEYRLKMLEWLDEHGSGGIGRLMRNSMMTLRQG